MGKVFGIRHDLLIGVLLILVTFAVFGQALNHEFVYDDKQYIVDNPAVRGGLSVNGFAWAFASTYAFNWHPLTWLSHMTDCSLFDGDASGHHFVNLLLHAANAVLLFLLLARMTGSVWRSAFVAALFAVHPLHIESVVWVAERKDMLSTLLGLLTIWAYVRYAESKVQGSRFKATYVTVIVLFALGLLAKPMLVTLPFVLLLLDYWPLSRVAPRRFAHITEKIPLFALSLLSSIMTYFAQHRGGAVAGLEEFPFSVRVTNALVTYVAYIRKMVLPTNLAIFYPHPGPSIPMWQVIGSVVFLMVVTLLVIRARRTRPYMAVGWLWYLGTLVPVIGLVQVGMQSMADRYTYVPLIGLFIMLSWGIPDLVLDPTGRTGQTGRTTVVSVVAAGVIVALGWTARGQVANWQSNTTLFEHALRVTKGNYLMENNLGFFLMEQGKLDEAARHFRAALRMSPKYGEAHVNLGNIFSALGNDRAAFREYLKAVEANPRLPQALFNLGTIVEQEGKLDEALDYYKRAAEAAPDCADFHVNVGRLLIQFQRLDEAAAAFERAVDCDPASAEANYNLGCILVEQRKPQEAEPYFEAVLRTDPTNAMAHLNLGAILVDQQKVSEGIAHYVQALKIKPDFAAAHHNLAIAYYFTGDYALARREIELCRKYGMEPNPGFLRALSEKR